MPDTQDKRDIAKDRAMCEALRLGQLKSVEMDYFEDGFWVEFTDGDGVFNETKAVPVYLVATNLATMRRVLPEDVEEATP